MTGHLRIDLGNPLIKGNFTVLKGSKQASGAHLVIQGAIKSFIEENKDNKVVYVSYTPSNNQQIFKKLTPEQ